MAERKIFAPSDEVVFYGVWIGPDSDGDWMSHLGGVVLYDLEQVDKGRQAATMVGGMLVPAVTVGEFMTALGGAMRRQAAQAPRAMRRMIESRISKMEKRGLA